MKANPRLPNCITPDNTCHGGALWKGLVDAKVCDRYISYDRFGLLEGRAWADASILA